MCIITYRRRILIMRYIFKKIAHSIMGDHEIKKTLGLFLNNFMQSQEIQGVIIENMLKIASEGKFNEVAHGSMKSFVKNEINYAKEGIENLPRNTIKRIPHITYSILKYIPFVKNIL